MKLSEAIRVGAKIRPQAFGSMEGHRHRLSWRCLLGRCQTEKTSCALQAAFEAGDCGSHVEVHSGESTKPFRGPLAVKKGQVVTIIENPQEWNEIFHALTICPQCGAEDDGKRTITHLNDVHRWTREEVARWVERVENGKEFAVKPVRTSDGNGTTESPYRTIYTHGPLDNIQSSLLYVRLQVAPILKQMFPGYGSCGRCTWPWPVVRHHETAFDKGSGCFPLCEDCWDELKTPENRLPYYMAMVDNWVSLSSSSESSTLESDRVKIRLAVLAETETDILQAEIIG